ncbi:DUF1631 domain-containing protein [Aquisalimonas sp. 2447]|uniref:DUF1631 domain-containing protein n=1 Tax=Aquisalimonas sp. 2447 TaxID=2740807 RepID=UPI0014327103|nr:DUF1631 domain-containing protein [Aquisalimonas sp. 2447]QIT54818.1 DUF1631 domain-containing protein [Aquisalimonas sp. 2447]
MSTENKIIHFGSSARGARTGLQERFRRLANERLMALLRHMLDQADDALFERAEKAGSNQEQQLFFEAMREVRRGRRAFEERFLERLEAAHLGEPVARQPGSAADQGDELSLVDDEHLEEELAIDGMVSKAQTRHSQALAHLCERLDADSDTAWATAETNPVDPRRIGAALEEGAAVLEMEIQPRLILYKLFDRYVVTQLGGFYQELNQLFIDAGVLPTIRPKARPSDGGTAVPRRPTQPRRPGSSPGDVSASGSGELSGREAEEAFAVLQNLLAARRPETEWSGTGYTSGGQAAPVGEVLEALSGLQFQAAPETDPDAGNVVPLSPDVLKQRVRQQMGRGDAAALGQAEDDTIDIVSMLFDAVLEDPNLPDSIKAVLARLQIPVLKVALLDRAFFSQRNHPARRLINDIARAGVGWTESDTPAKDPLYQAIERIVTRVLDEFSDDVTVFENAREEFRQFLEDDRARAHQIEERTRQAAEGKAKVDSAREKVDAAMRERIGGRQLPDCAERLLHEGWSQVLFIALLREGEDSEAWRKKLDVVERLVWSLDPKPDHASRKQLVSEIPPLLHDLRTDLNAVMFNPIEMTKLFKALEEEHIKTLSRRPDAAPPVADTTGSQQPEVAGVTGEAEPEETVFSGEALESAGDDLDAYRERLDQVAIGTWFEFRQDSGKHLRAKLSARLSGGDRLIFVNRAGFKLADRRRDELAEALRKESVLLLDDNMLFDKALENVVANLRSMRDAR